MVLEVCADSVASAIAAESGGAQRIELCSDLLEGGITPGSGLLSVVRKRVGIDIFVMIRPRGGDFVYSEDEFEVMRYDIEEARRLGANGVVLGLLDDQGRIDVKRTRALVEQAAPLPVTFHRAIDMTPDPMGALEQVIETGVHRILSSGGASRVADGCELLSRFVDRGKGRIAVMAGGGLTVATLPQVAKATGVTEFHASLRRLIPSRVNFRKQGVAMGEVADREYVRYATLEEDVREMGETLKQVPTEHLTGETR